jgi:hypothetical protein
VFPLHRSPGSALGLLVFNQPIPSRRQGVYINRFSSQIAWVKRIVRVPVWIVAQPWPHCLGWLPSQLTLATLSTDKMDGKQADSAIKNFAMATSSLLPDVITERTLFASLPIVYLILKYIFTIISLYTAR